VERAQSIWFSTPIAQRAITRALAYEGAEYGLAVDGPLLPALSAPRRPLPREAPPPQSLFARAGYHLLDLAAPIVEGTYAAALASAGCAAAATDSVLRTRGVAFALCRPPGHHAGRDFAGGFCYLNNAALAARTAALNERQYTALHFTGPGTDLTIGLPVNHRWIGGAAPTAIGISNVANIPTEEIFTAPHRARVEGTVRATMPLSLSGKLVKDFAVTFAGGRVVDVHAAEGEALLRSLIETDEGAARLGEIALVPAGSPISQSGILFYNTLFDENAASHIALGRAYRNCIAGCEGLDDDDFSALGGNNSNTHVDFMIGSAEIDVDGITGDGAVEPLMRAGEWVS